MRFRLFIFIVLAGMLLCACHKPSKAPDMLSQVKIPDRFEHLSHTADLSGIQQWWERFNDPVLNDLVCEAMDSAPDLSIAQARVKQAKALFRLADADFGATVSAGLGVGLGVGTGDNPLPDAFKMPLTQIGSDLSQDNLDSSGQAYQFSLAASWEPDFFGKKQSISVAASYALLSEKERLHGTYILLTATLVRHYLQVRSLEMQKQVIFNNIAALNELERYVSGRYLLGEVTNYDIEDIRAKVAAMRAEIDLIDAVCADHLRQIAVLSGRTPQSVAIAPSTTDLFKTLPAAPDGQYPSDLIARRPDIRARAAAIMAYAAKRSSAVADYYPRFTLDFLAGTGSLNLGGDLDGLKNPINTTAALLGLGVHLPIFTNGRIKANVDQADAQLRQALAQYDRTLLKALAEVESSYQLDSALIRQHRHLSCAEGQSDTQADHARQLFEFGRLTFDKMIIARMNTYNYTLKRQQNELGRALNLVRLYSALGGDWTSLQSPRSKTETLQPQ